VPKKTLKHKIAHIRPPETEAENSASSSADDVKRLFTRFDEEAEKGSPTLVPHQICLAASCGTTSSSIFETTTRKPLQAKKWGELVREKREAQSLRVLGFGVTKPLQELCSKEASLEADDAASYAAS